ncbi:hypothetical protein LSAT2_012846 [Lamellibrachia satsuma]|nr:hypothetical protein LSAT2_012846 [Lamellibrachia satsuma]
MNDDEPTHPALGIENSLITNNRLRCYGTHAVRRCYTNSIKQTTKLVLFDKVSRVGFSEVITRYQLAALSTKAQMDM